MVAFQISRGGEIYHETHISLDIPKFLLDILKPQLTIPASLMALYRTINKMSS